MRKLFGIVVVLFLSVVSVASAQVFVDGYYRSDGTYVAPHWRSSPNNTVTDNYSYYGNVNPFTGSIGTNRYYDNPTSGYYNGGLGNSFGSGNSLGSGTFGSGCAYSWSC